MPEYHWRRKHIDKSQIHTKVIESIILNWMPKHSLIYDKSIGGSLRIQLEYINHT